VWQKVQTLACQQPKAQGRWTVRTLAREVGLPPSPEISHALWQKAASSGITEFPSNS
jgi:hypothetical protein